MDLDKTTRTIKSLDDSTLCHERRANMQLLFEVIVLEIIDFVNNKDHSGSSSIIYNKGRNYYSPFQKIMENYWLEVICY